VDERHDCRNTDAACVPSTVWGTASNLTAKFRSAPCLPLNTGKPSTRGPAPRRPSLAAAIRPHIASATEYAHSRNSCRAVNSMFAVYPRILAAIGSPRQPEAASVVSDRLVLGPRGAGSVRPLPFDRRAVPRVSVKSESATPARCA
jgi:hypothetical protein